MMDYNHNGIIDKEDIIIEEEMNQLCDKSSIKDTFKGFILFLLGLIIICGLFQILL